MLSRPCADRAQRKKIMRDSWIRRAWTWVQYRGISTIVHQPRLLRLIARTFQRYPGVGYASKAVAARDDVVAAFDRPLSFSSTAHRPNLVAGEFAIGMESGARHAAERRLLQAHLPPPAVFEQFASLESRRRSDALLAGPARRFDLIDDYLLPVAWQAISGSFGAELPVLGPGDPMFSHLRYIGAHLIVGTVATEAVQARAMASAAALNAWVRSNIRQLHAAWAGAGALSNEEVARNVVGMLWVGHPATVQSGALVMQEVLSRRSDPLLRGLVDDILRHADPWQDAALRARLRQHVLELLRFRPPFPILHRDVRRDTLFGAKGKGRIAGGTVLTLFAIGAMFDPSAMRKPGMPPGDYDPDRAFKDSQDRHLMFGHGARQCVARDQVVEILTSALLGLLRLPRLTWADPWWRRMRYDGPIVTSMPLRFRRK